MVSWQFKTVNYALFSSSPPPLATQLARLSNYIDMYKTYGINTISLSSSVPIDPLTGGLKQTYENRPIGTPDIATVKAMTDLAHAKGMQVIWHPVFALDSSTSQVNVNDLNSPNLDANAVLSSVKSYWSRWAEAAQSSGADLLILGGEMRDYAFSHEAQWRDIISSVRAVYSGKLTYSELGYPDGNGQLLTDQVKFWDALDYIGAENYWSSILQLTGQQQSIFDNKWFPAQRQSTDIPGSLWNLSQKYGKPIFFGEVGAPSNGHALTDPGSFALDGSTDFVGQETFFKTFLDAFSNFDWVAGANLWTSEGNFTPDPINQGWDSLVNIRQGYSFVNKPAGEIVRKYWLSNQTPPALDELGSNNSETMIGGYQGDTLRGLGGNDTLIGGTGIDTAVYQGAKSQYSVNVGSVTVVTDRTANRDGSDTLTSVERLKFSDTVVAVDTEGNSGQAYRMYQAAFARTPDKDGVSFWVSQVDKGLSLHDMATVFMGSNEFKGIYGASPSVPTLVTGFYTNVLGRAPDASGLSFWVGQVQSGLSTADMLVSFSESGENKAHVAPAIQNGIELSLSFFA